MARPTKLTPEVSEEICKALEDDGAFIETAAQAAGIDHSTLYRWLDRGLKGEEPFAAFCEAVARARAMGELKLLRDVRRGDDKGIGFGRARGSAFILERTRRAYAQRVRIDAEEAVEQVIEVFRGICTPEDFGRALEQIERLDRGDSGAPSPAGDQEGPAEVH